MPIRTDGTGRRWVEMTFVAPARPEQVWRAMATAAGNAAWFTNATIEERAGGRLEFDMGANGTSKGEVTMWAPPRHFGYVEREWFAGAPEVATDITIERRSGDHSLVRMIHTIHSDADTWDAHLEGFEAGWPVFFEVLKLYLTHFPDLPAAAFQVVHPVKDAPLAVWTRLTTALNLSHAHAGEACHLAPQAQPWIGIVERIEQSHDHRVIVLRLESPAPGIALVGAYAMPGDATVNASVGAFFYGETAAGLASHSEHSLREWLPQVFAESATPPSA